MYNMQKWLVVNPHAEGEAWILSVKENRTVLGRDARWLRLCLCSCRDHEWLCCVVIRVVE